MSEKGRFDTLINLSKGRRRTPIQIQSFQARQLRRVLHHAWHKVPYYRKLFEDNNIGPTDLDKPDALQKIPITSKRDFRNYPDKDRIASDIDPKDHLVYRTSGSTGEPFTVYNSRSEELIQALFRIRIQRSSGMIWPAKLARIRTPGKASQSIVYRLLKMFKIYQVNEINSYDQTELIKAQLLKIQPDGLFTYPGSAMRVAKIMSPTDRARLKLKWILIGGSVVHSEVKRQIEEGFGVRPLEVYASRETAHIAWECPETGYFHVADDAMILETLQDRQPSECGEVVITMLHSFVQPFIRYRLHDWVSRGPRHCPCGQPYSTIRHIKGRINDALILPGKRVFPPSQIYRVLEQWQEQLVQYQLSQEREEHVTLKVVTRSGLSQTQLAEINQACKRLLGPDVQFNIEITDEILPDESGKYKMTVSKVSA